PLRLVAMPSSKSASSSSWTAPTIGLPALQTATSSPPTRSTAPATPAETPPALRTSPSTSPPARSSTTTAAPSSRKRSTVAAPMPDAPPVTSARFPASRPLTCGGRGASSRQLLEHVDLEHPAELLVRPEIGVGAFLVVVLVVSALQDPDAVPVELRDAG